jgi:hypothetical protein
MAISEAVRILSDGARQPFQGVAVKAEAPFSLKMARVADL